MTSVLEEFARGNISPEACFFERNSHYGRMVKKLTDAEDELLASLDEKQKRLFQTFTDAQTEIGLSSEASRFVYGYRLGVLMTVEVFEGQDNLIVGREDSQ